ncbi:ubiquitin carboxyl-terminal hydrolase [Mortierella claussenii]|nr:ubiquitin carboxyl-terminal hydrolase [Mortierella claussenii]
MARNSIKNSKTPTFRTAPVKAPAKPAVSSEFTSLGGHWCTIESSPAVFNALVEKNGIRGAYVKEVWSLEPELFDLFKKDTVVYGFIFLLRPQAHRLSKIEFMVTDDDGGLDSWSFQVGNSQSNKEDLGDNGQRSGGTEQKDRKTGIYFANQVIPDACGTQALLSIAMNSPGLDIGPMLYNFKDFTARFDPKASRF